MTKKDKYLLLLFIAIGGMLFGACKQERPPCLTPTNVYMTVEAMHLASDTATVFTDTGMSYPRFVPLSAVKNVVYVYGGGSLYNITLSPDADSCRWLFANDTLLAVTDTILFHYKRNLQFLSNACGYTYFYTLTSVSATHNLIDSVHLNSNSVTNNVNGDPPKQVQLYIHPAF